MTKIYQILLISGVALIASFPVVANSGGASRMEIEIDPTTVKPEGKQGEQNAKPKLVTSSEKTKQELMENQSRLLAFLVFHAEVDGMQAQ